MRTAVRLCLSFVVIVSILPIVIFIIVDDRRTNTSQVEHVEGSSASRLDDKAWCDVGNVEVNDSDAVVDSCRFPRISQSADLERRIDRLLPIDLPLLSNYKNPCWYESLPPTWMSEYRAHRQMFPDQANKSFRRMIQVLERRQSRLGHPWRLRCMPLVYVIGVAKCGTTDLFHTLKSHPHVIRGATKEPFYWDRLRWKANAPLTDYLALYDEAADVIRNTTVPRTDETRRPVAYHPMVTIDASVNMLFRFDGASQLPANGPLAEPRYIAADLIRNLMPRSDIKVMAMVRNPTDRLLSAYLFYNTMMKPSPISAEEFHSIASDHVTRLDQCFRSRSLRSCVYDEKVNLVRKWTDVRAGLYFPFIKDWINVFPSMKVLTTEEYKANRTRIYHYLLDYIGLDDVTSDYAQSSGIIGKGPKPAFKMLTETRRMLDNFYKPFNEMLADMFGDRKFLFA